MKKGVLLTFIILCVTFAVAQKRTIFVNESFNTIDFPEGWSIKGGGNYNWSISETCLAGGEPNELKFSWTPKLYGTSRVVTNAVDMTNVTEVHLSLKHYLSYYTEDNTIGVATTSDDGATWNVAWQQTYSATGNYVINESISTPDMGKDNVKFCLFFSGASNTIKEWCFDDFMILTQGDNDINLLSIDVDDKLNAGETDISFTIQNEGVADVTSFEARYEIEGIGSATQTFNTDISTLATKKFTFASPAVIPSGTYKMSIEILSVNNDTDNYINNNRLEKDLTVVLGLTDRKPLIEHFSASTCVNCPPVNSAMSQLTHLNQDRYTYVKYPVDWPGTGDPYFTAEVGERTYFYGVLGVPQIFLDARDMGTPLSQADLNERYNEPSFVDIKGSFSMDGDIITVKADFMSYRDLDNVNAFIVVNEKVTENNVGSTSETEFHHVMMKMLGGTEGTVISLKAGEVKHLEFSYDMSDTFMEENDDLEVALWLQNLNDWEVYNSDFAYGYSSHPYPAQNLTLTKNGDKLDITWEKPASSEPIGYNLYVNNRLVKDNTQDTHFTYDNVGDICIVKVETLYQDMQAVSVVKTLDDDDNTIGIEESDAGIEIYPNPTKNTLFVDSDTAIKEISIYNIMGIAVYKNDNFESDSIDMSQFESGVYFVEISTETSVVTKKIVKE